jgi:hypothetical protein
VAVTGGGGARFDGDWAATTLRVKMEMRGRGARGSDRRGFAVVLVVVRAQNDVPNFSRSFILFSCRITCHDGFPFKKKIQPICSRCVRMVR